MRARGRECTCGWSLSIYACGWSLSIYARDTRSRSVHACVARRHGRTYVCTDAQTHAPSLPPSLPAPPLAPPSLPPLHPPRPSTLSLTLQTGTRFRSTLSVSSPPCTASSNSQPPPTPPTPAQAPAIPTARAWAGRCCGKWRCCCRCCCCCGKWRSRSGAQSAGRGERQG